MNKLRIKNWFIIDRALIWTHLAPLTQKCPLYYGFTIQKERRQALFEYKEQNFLITYIFLHRIWKIILQEKVILFFLK